MLWKTLGRMVKREADNKNDNSLIKMKVPRYKTSQKDKWCTRYVTINHVIKVKKQT